MCTCVWQCISCFFFSLLWFIHDWCVCACYYWWPSLMLILFICCRLVVSSEEAQHKDARSFVKGIFMKITDMLVKAKVLIVALTILLDGPYDLISNKLSLSFLAGFLCIVSWFWGGYHQCIFSSCDADDVIKNDWIQRHWAWAGKDFVHAKFWLDQDPCGWRCWEIAWN